MKNFVNKLHAANVLEKLSLVSLWSIYFIEMEDLGSVGRTQVVRWRATRDRVK